MAEGEGFEPPVPFQAQRFSRPPVSTAHPSLRGRGTVLDCTAKPLFGQIGGLRDEPNRLAPSPPAGRGAFALGGPCSGAARAAKTIEITVH